MYAITPKGTGNPPGARAIQRGWPLEPGETFTVDLPSVEGLVLAANGKSLREELPADKVSRRNARIDASANAKMRNPNAENDAIAALLALVIADVAALKGLDPEAYRDDLLDRLKA